MSSSSKAIGVPGGADAGRWLQYGVPLDCTSTRKFRDTTVRGGQTSLCLRRGGGGGGNNHHCAPQN